MGLIEKLYVQMSALEATVDQGRAKMAINQRELDRVQAELAQVHTGGGGGHRGTGAGSGGGRRAHIDTRLQRGGTQTLLLLGGLVA